MPFLIESALVSWLSENLDVPCFGPVPRNKPDMFLTVERTGGSSSPGIDHPNISIQVWGTDNRLEVIQLALEVRDLMNLRAVEIPQVRSSQVNSGPYEFPDPDSGRARSQIYVNMTTE